MLKTSPIHTILFATIPIFFLYSKNFYQIKFSDILLPLFINLGIGLFSFIGSYFFTKNKQQAGLEASIVLIIFSSFGHIWNFIIDNSTPNVLLLFVTSMLVVFIVASWLIFRVLKDFRFLTELLNVVSIFLLTFQMLSFSKILQQIKPDLPIPAIEYSQKPLSTPDIYYIILDGYGGEEMLLDLYNYDNQDIIQFFENNGFYVANRSGANYIRTVQSLSSTLNLDYFSNGDWIKDSYRNGFDIFRYLITNNKVKNQLKFFGYQIYVIPNNFGLTEWENASLVGKIPFGTPFLWEYMRTTALAFFWYDLPYSVHRTQVLNSFNLLENSVELPSPKFVFAHILSPHPPFVFKQDGSKTQPNHPYTLVDANDLEYPVNIYQTGYVQQLQYINKIIEKTISYILSKSENPPIIIVQGDHGPGSLFDFYSIKNNQCLLERLSILNAYHLPGFDYNLLYPEISPINSFRIIFSHYFELQYSLLPDQSFYSPSNNMIHFTDVTDQLDNKYCDPMP